MTEGLKELFKEKESLDERIAILKADLDGINEQINKAVEGQCKQVRDLRGKDYGVIDIVIDGIQVKHNVPKKVTWDEEELAALYKRIEDTGDEPMDFIDKKVTYSIPEKKYKTIPLKLKKVFDKFRTVDVGAVTVKLSWADEKL